ncbi:MAG: exodeoxyribonuclease VII large subunit [Oligoflexia bacterium]|nr:exodeoxyribonuclease VII large subunit [Oligoflexia bacterium]
MSEQLTLDEMLNLKTQGNEPAPAPKKKTITKTPADDNISARIRALAEEKNKNELVSTKNTIPVLPEKNTLPVLPEAVAVKSEPEVITVSQLNKSIKGILEKSFPFIWVKGEISNLKIPSSGHLYFTLKDAGGQVRSVMFKGFAQAMKFRPEDGMEVLVRCRVTVYEPRGDYQLFCEVMEPVGFGALQVAFEKLKAQLQKEGLFDVARKKQIPPFPARIAIITSPTGAVIRDMLNVLGRRFGKGLDITILPCSVQGDKAPGEIATAIKLVDKMGLDRFDVLIIGRGGGSLEDLWAFNTEEVARAVSGCRIPTISAVGHEVDFTICDFVADLRAPTPSAAAELVVKNKADLQERLRLLASQLTQQMMKKLQLVKAHAQQTAKRLIDPKRRLQDLMLRSDEWTERLLQSMQRFIQDSELQVKFLLERMGTPEKHLELAVQKLVYADEKLRLGMNKCVDKKRSEFSSLAALFDGLSPLKVLGRGYSIVKKQDQIIKSAAQVNTGDLVQISLSEGELSAIIK